MRGSRSSNSGNVYRNTIKQWPEGERPREKMYQQGSSAISAAELLAILMRTGVKGRTALDEAKRLLVEVGSLQEIAQLQVKDLEAFKIGRAKASAIVAAFELARRVPGDDGKKRPIFRSPDEVANRYLLKFRDLRHEEFWVLVLNSANQLVREERVSTGTLNASLVHPRECFQVAIKEKAASVIFLHNHPSGNPEPSQEDLSITKQLVESGKILGIPVHDHIILGGNSYTSLAERGAIQ